MPRLREHLLQVWEKMVNSGKMSRPQFVSAVSTLAAQVFNIFPQKGASNHHHHNKWSIQHRLGSIRHPSGSIRNRSGNTCIVARLVLTPVPNIETRHAEFYSWENSFSHFTPIHVHPCWQMVLPVFAYILNGGPWMRPSFTHSFRHSASPGPMSASYVSLSYVSLSYVSDS